MFLALFDVADMKSKLFLAQSILHVWSMVLTTSIFHQGGIYKGQHACSLTINTVACTIISKVYAHNMSFDSGEFKVQQDFEVLFFF
jgi:hypothetical protein